MSATSRCDVQTPDPSTRTGSGCRLGPGFQVGVVAGSGFVARAASTGGADFLLALNVGRLRNMGCPSIACMMPMADADALTLDFAEREVLPATALPVLLGTSSWGRPPDAEALLARGFVGAVNFPSAMHYGTAMQTVLQRAGLGFDAEVERLSAVQAAGGIAMLYCGTREHARAGAEAGIDHLLFNYGWNAGSSQSGRPGHAARMSLHEAAQIAHDVSRMVRRIHPRTKLLLEGGPIVSADDLGFVVRSAAIDGYIGGSTIERLPLERSVADRIAAYRLAQHQPSRADAERERSLRWGARAGFVGTSDALVAYLAKLRTVAQGRSDLVLEVEDGGEIEPSLDAIRDAMGIGRRTGRSAVIDALRPPATLPSTAALLIVRHPSAMPDELRQAVENGIARIVRIERHGTVGPEARSDDLRLAVPPLRDRADDIEALWTAGLDAMTGARTRRRALSASALLRLRGHDWPGNERELRNVVRTVALAMTDADVHADEIDEALDGLHVCAVAHPDPRDRILEALWRNGYRKGRTAAALGIGRKTLYNRMKRYGISG